MKGKLSKDLQQILRNPKTLAQLQNILLFEGEGDIQLGDDIFEVKMVSGSRRLTKPESRTNKDIKLKNSKK